MSLAAPSQCQVCMRHPAVKQVWSASGTRKLWKCALCAERKNPVGLKYLGTTAVKVVTR